MSFVIERITPTWSLFDHLLLLVWPGLPFCGQIQHVANIGRGHTGGSIGGVICLDTALRGGFFRFSTIKDLLNGHREIKAEFV
jgi:hypothetical protein